MGRLDFDELITIVPSGGFWSLGLSAYPPHLASATSHLKWFRSSLRPIPLRLGRGIRGSGCTMQRDDLEDMSVGRATTHITMPLSSSTGRCQKWPILFQPTWHSNPGDVCTDIQTDKHTAVSIRPPGNMECEQHDTSWNLAYASWTLS